MLNVTNDSPFLLVVLGLLVVYHATLNFVPKRKFKLIPTTYPPFVPELLDDPVPKSFSKLITSVFGFKVYAKLDLGH